MRFLSLGYDPEAIIPTTPARAPAARSARQNAGSMGGPLMPRQPLVPAKKGLSLIQTGSDVMGGGFTDGVGQGVGMGMGMSVAVIGVASAYAWLKGKRLV